MRQRLDAFSIGVFVGIWALAIVLLFSQSIRLDESQSIWISTKSVAAIIVTVSQDVHVPLYELLLHFWMQIFGSSIVAARSLSLLFFIGSVPALYYLANNSSTKSVARLTLVLFALSPFIMWYSSEARMYTLFTFVTIISNIFFLQFIRSQGRRGKFGYLLVTIAGLYSHYFFLLVVAVQGLYIILTRRRLLLPFILIMILAFLSFAPWIIYMIAQGFAANTQPLIPRPSSFNILQTFVMFIFGFQPTIIQTVIISLWPILIIFLFLIFTKQGHKLPAYNLDYFFLATFIPIIAVFVVSYIKPVFLSRYLIFVTPTLFFLIAWTLLANKNRFTSVMTVIITVVLFALIFYQNTSAKTPVREDYQAVANYLDKSATPHDVIAVSPPFTVYPLEYSYAGNSKIVTFPEWNRFVAGPIPAFSEQNFANQLNILKQQYIHLFVILSYDQGYESRLRSYLDRHYQMVRQLAFPSGIKLREYVLRYDVQTINLF